MARTPLYKAAETEMIRRIESGEWEVGKRLPNEFVLAEEFKVSQGTMRRALMTLEGMGLLNRKPGRGTLVARPAGKPRAVGRQRRTP
jgi:GntR family transcriptional regulator